jgi:hypothetical protein
VGPLLSAMLSTPSRLCDYANTLVFRHDRSVSRARATSPEQGDADSGQLWAGTFAHHVRPEWKAIMNSVEDLLREGMERSTEDLRAATGSRVPG